MFQRFQRLTLLFIFLFLFHALALANTACGSWQWANPIPQGNTLNSVTYANGLWVAVGDCGTILTSPDGVTWTVCDSGVTNDLKDAAWGNGKWVVVGYQDTILTSTDGGSWTLRHSGDIYGNFESITWGANQFVATGSSGLITTSPDAMSWTRRSLYLAEWFYDIAWNGAVFVAVGGGDIATSPDAIIWTSQVAQIGLGSIISTGGIFVAVGGGVAISPDGYQWTYYHPGSNPGLWGIGYGNGLFVAVGRYSGDSGWVYVAETSQDGVTWEEHVLDAPDVPTAVAWGADRFITVGNNGCLLSSPDGSSWSSSNAVSLFILNAVTQGDGQFVAVGEDGTILSSPDAAVWTLRGLRPGHFLNGVAFGAELYVAVGWWDTVVTSPDAVTWTYRTAGTGSHLQGVTFANGQFVAVGYGVAATSPDGITWTVQALDQPGYLLNCVIWTGSQYFAGGSMCTAASPDGLHWQLTILEEKYDFQDVLWDGHKFVAAGYLGYEPEGTQAIILTSPDGDAWQVAHTGPYLSQYAGVARRADGRYVVVGGRGEILSSADAVSWVPERTGTYRWFKGVRSFDDLTIAIGEEGAILRQACGPAPPLPGDCDGDGTVSIGEVQKAINMFLGLEPAACGVNCSGSGTVSIGEVQKVINAFLGLPAQC